MNIQEIRNIAIKRHDLDADYFQNVYSGNLKSSQSEVFLYGRNMILEELEIILSSIPRNARILDVGCGTGHLTQLLKEKGYNVFGLEPSEEMYKYSIKNFPDIDFKKGISSSLPYDNDSFDLIISIEVLRYLSPKDNELTYKEFHRVLKNGGKFFVTHLNLLASDGYYLFYWIKKTINRIVNKPYHFCNFTTAGKQFKILAKLNFRNIETIGRMAAFVRVLFKFGTWFGKNMGSLVKRTSRQRYTKSFMKLISGHLIVIGQK